MANQAHSSSASAAAGPGPGATGPFHWWERFRPAGRAVRSFFMALYPCRFALIAVALPGMALLAVPQMQECLRALAERGDGSAPPLLQWTPVFLAAIYWAASAWYWTRQLLGFRFHRRHPVDAAFHRARVLLPRSIGTAALALLALGIWRAGTGYRAASQTAGLLRELHVVAAAMAIVALLFYLLVHFRRQIFRLPQAVDVARARELPRQTLIVLGVTLAATLTLFIAFTAAPTVFAPRLGAVTILLMAAAAWCTAGSMAVFVDGRYGLPVLSMAIVAVLLFSFWNDNHALRQLKEPMAPRHSLESYAEAWLAERRADITASGHYPVVIVATAGGGIRAAYWTGSLLAALQDRYGAAFSEHTFAISGVSGGSLGAATYATLVDESLRTGRPLACPGQPMGGLQSCARAVLSRDFLAPVIGSMLFPDLTQRFLPVGIPLLDRGRVLETAWEQAWRDQHLPDDLSKAFYGLWADLPTAVHRPLLFLNSTLVETGERVIVTPVELPNGTEFSGARELYALTPANLRLSSAAHLSARFTYVSPAATIYDKQGELAGHLVDGGYFENSGSDTAAGLVDAVRRAARSSLPRETRLNIIVLMISNQPGEEAGQERPSRSPERWLTELRAPIAALLNAREARGWEAEAAIERRVGTRGCVLALGLKESGIDLPLGWTLSETAQLEIDRQLAEAGSETAPAEAVAALDSVLAPGRFAHPPVGDGGCKTAGPPSSGS